MNLNHKLADLYEYQELALNHKPGKNASIIPYLGQETIIA